jgi:Sec-independent protein translocase protein TatA
VNFLNIGPSELMVILAIAILAIGPKRMVEIARTLGRATSKLRKISGEFMTIIRAELQETQATTLDLVDGTITGEAGVSGEVQATGKQARGTVEGLKEEIGLASLRAELQETERATREFLQKVAEEDEEEEKGDLAEAEEAPQKAELAEPVGTTAPEQALPEPVTKEQEAVEAPEAVEETEEAQAQPMPESPKEELGLASLQAELQDTDRAVREFLQKVAEEDEEEKEGDLAETEAEEGVELPEGIEVAEKEPLSPEEARVGEAVTRAAELAEPEQAEAEKADENDRQE